MAVGSIVANLVVYLCLSISAMSRSWPPRARPQDLLATLALDLILAAAFYSSALGTDAKTRRLAGFSICLALLQQLFPLYGYYMNSWEAPWIWVFATLIPVAVCSVLYRRLFILGMVVIASGLLFLPFVIPPVGGPARSQSLDGLTLTITSSGPSTDGQPGWIPWQRLGISFRTTDGSDPLQRVYFHGITMEGSISPFFHLRSPAWVRGLRMEDGSARSYTIVETPASARSFNLEVDVPLYPTEPDCSFNLPLPDRHHATSKRVPIGSGSILASISWDKDLDSMYLTLSNPLPPDAASGLVFNYSNSLESPFEPPGPDGEFHADPIQLFDPNAKYFVLNGYKRSLLQSHVLRFKFSRLGNRAGY